MFSEFEPVLSLSVIASKWCLLQGTRLREYLWLSAFHWWGGVRPRPQGGADMPSLLSQSVAELGLRTQSCGSRYQAFSCSAFLPHLSAAPFPSPLPFFTTPTTFCFLVQMVMILLLHSPFLPNRSLCSVQVLVTDITRHPSFLITFCS